MQGIKKYSAVVTSIHNFIIKYKNKKIVLWLVLLKNIIQLNIYT